ncbi:MAG: helix-turn-helix transcriptional regulator [Oceanipulchritudo sp.]
MRIERSARFIEPGGTCLELLLGNSCIAVREEVAGGTRFEDFKFQGINLILVDAGRTTYRIGEQLCPMSAGSLLVVASGIPYDQWMEFDVNCHYTYLILSGPLAANWPVRFPSACAFRFFEEAPAGMVDLVRGLVDTALEQPHGWSLCFARDLFAFLGELEAAVDETDASLSLQQRVERLVDRNPGKNWTLGRLARRLGLGESTLAHRFKREFGHSPIRFITAHKMGHARALLRQGYKVSEVAEMLGFGNLYHFSAAFRRHTGKPPSSFKLEALPGAGSRKDSVP